MDQRKSLLESLVTLHHLDRQQRSRDAEESLRTLEKTVALHAGAVQTTRESLRQSDHELFLRPSIFELMEHNFRENTHSNVLQYLFDPERGASGKDVLKAFLQFAAPDFLEDLDTYSIHREFEITHEGNHGRIDLLVTAPDQSWIVAIENKVLAEISEREAYGTQLDFYRIGLQSRFPNAYRAHILLSFQNPDVVPTEWHFADYTHLLRAIAVDSSNDPILREYRRLLLCLLADTTIRDLTSTARSVLKGDGTSSLTQMNQLKEFLYAFREI